MLLVGSSVKKLQKAAFTFAMHVCIRRQALLVGFFDCKDMPNVMHRPSPVSNVRFCTVKNDMLLYAKHHRHCVRKY